MLSKYCPERAQEACCIKIIVIAVCQQPSSSIVSLLIIISNMTELYFAYPSICLNFLPWIVSYCVWEITVGQIGFYYYCYHYCCMCEHRLTSTWGLASDPFIKRIVHFLWVSLWVRGKLGIQLIFRACSCQNESWRGNIKVFGITYLNEGADQCSRRLGWGRGCGTSLGMPNLCYTAYLGPALSWTKRERE